MSFEGRHYQCKFGSERQRFDSHGFGKQFKEDLEDPAVETSNSSITEDIIEKVNEKSDSINVKKINKSNDEAEQCNDERVNTLNKILKDKTECITKASSSLNIVNTHLILAGK